MLHGCKFPAKGVSFSDFSAIFANRFRPFCLRLYIPDDKEEYRFIKL